MARETTRRIGDILEPGRIVEEWALSACEGKQVFESAQMAHHVAKKRRQKSQHYRCKCCGKYHVATIRHGANWK